MHIALILEAPERGEVRLPKASLSLLQAAIYGMLPHDMAQDLHDEGFRYEKRQFKLFTFAWLRGRGKKRFSGNQVCFASPLTFEIASPLDGLLGSMAAGIMERGSLRLGNNHLECTELRTRSYEAPQGEKASLDIRALSPITCYSTLLRQDGRKFTHFHSPRDGDFQKLLGDNLRKKYALLFPHEEVPPGEVSLEPLGNSFRETAAKFCAEDALPIRGWWGNFRLCAPGELIQVALDAGLGSKNSGGWGCIRPLKDEV